MEATVHHFARLLRAAGVRISVSETLDALAGAAAPGILADRALLREALRTSLVKDHRDDDRFDELFAAFFAFVRFSGEPSRRRARDLEEFTLAEELGQRPPRADMESPDAEVGDLFDRSKLVERYSPHPELNPIVLDNDTTDEIVFSQQDVGSLEDSNSVRLDVDRTHGADPGAVSTAPGTKLDTELSLAEQDALLGWLDDAADPGGDEDDATAIRARLAGLPEALKRHLEYLISLQHTVEGRRVAPVGELDGREQDQLEAAVRRLVHSLRGAPTHRKREHARGRLDSARTMRRNLRYDGVPFRPVTVAKAEDKPRLVVLADVSLSVRATARFTLHLVHRLQGMFGQVRTFAFVADLAEITGLFGRYYAEEALGRVFGGDVLDIDANSDYGRVFGTFLGEHGASVTRRTTVLVLGDGRGNGNDPNLPAFEELTRRARETIWLTQEPRYSWGLGPCDLPAYAEFCDRVRVVRDLSGLDSAATDLASARTGR
ncbi:VWA domain-containing protein [Amycolatopsis sp. NPDC004378]